MNLCKLIFIGIYIIIGIIIINIRVYNWNFSVCYFEGFGLCLVGFWVFELGIVMVKLVMKSFFFFMLCWGVIGGGMGFFRGGIFVIFVCWFCVWEVSG